MDSEDTPETEGEIPVRPRTPERSIFFWSAILFGANMVSLLLLAARANSPAHLHGFFDVAIFACIAGVAAFGIVRFMFLSPFRLLDLLVMVIVLAFGMKAAIEIAHWIQRSPYYGMKAVDIGKEMSLLDSGAWPLFAETCMGTACVLMFGAALGLRNCRLMDVQTPLKRALVLACGMLALPAPICMFAIPFHLLSELITEKQTSEHALAWIIALGFAATITLTNWIFSIKTIALTTENATQEPHWDEK